MSFKLSIVYLDKLGAIIVQHWKESYILNMNNKIIGC